jgi:hypothetical protein
MLGRHPRSSSHRLFFAASVAKAGPIVYDVTVDTSSIAGTMGSLDFQFNPGPLKRRRPRSRYLASPATACWQAVPRSPAM